MCMQGIFINDVIMLPFLESTMGQWAPRAQKRWLPALGDGLETKLVLWSTGVKSPYTYTLNFMGTRTRETRLQTHLRQRGHKKRASVITAIGS